MGERAAWRNAVIWWVLAGSAAFAEPAPVSSQASAKVSAKKGVKSYETESVDYEFLAYPGIAKEDVVLETRRTGRESAGAELVRGTLKIRALRLGKGGKATPLWAFEEDADHSMVRRDLGVLTTRYDGCCGSSDAYRLHSLEQGKLLFPYAWPEEGMPSHVDALWLRDDSYRFVGFIDSYWPARDKAADVAPKEQNLQTFGVVSYSSKTALLQRVAILREKWDDPPQPPESWWLVDDAKPDPKGAKPSGHLELDGMVRQRPPEAAKAFDSFSVHLRFAAGEPELVLKFKGDRISLTESLVPKPYKLVELP